MKKVISLIIIALIMALMTYGCVKEESDPIAAVIIIGNHKNAKVVSDDYLREEVENVYGSIGNLAFIVADGSPEIEHYKGTILGYRNKTEINDNITKCHNNRSHWRDEELQNDIKELMKTVGSLKADSEEVDLLEAIFEAKSALNKINADEFGMKKEIIIYDPGISTKGSVVLTEDFFKYDEEKIEDFIDTLDDANLLPELDDITIKWYGIGEVASPQEKIDHSKSALLKKFWRTLIEKKGGAIIIDDADLTDESDSEYDVSVIEFSDPEPVSENIFTIYFEKDSVTYVNASDATYTLSKASDEIKSSKGTWYVIGCEAGRTADGVDGLKNHISTKRAEIIVRALHSLGVSDAKIIPVSLGPYDPWHIEDYDKNENWLENKAAGNRKVVIIHSQNKYISESIDFINKGIID